jgi:photosystem II stability/assembly factor-like uncharacterized protein
MKLREEDKKRRVSYAFIPHPSSLILCFVVLCGWTAQCVVSAAESGVWVRQRSPSLAWLKRVRFLDARQGWVAGSNGTLLRTVDGGARWEAMPRPTVDNLRDVWFTDANHGWLLCEADDFNLTTRTEPRSYILRTVDGGATWLRANPTAPATEARLVRFVFINERIGWTFGESGLLYQTEDGGATWTKRATPAPVLVFGGVFLDAGRGWLVGGGGTIWRTFDAGATWRESKVSQPLVLQSAAEGLTAKREPGAGTGGAGVSLRAIAFTDARRGWAVGAGGHVWATMDGGVRWTRQASGTEAYLSDVAFLNARDGWAVGTNGTTIATADGGRTWTSEVAQTQHRLESVAAMPGAGVWAVGFGGTILRREAGNGAVAHPHLRTNR